MLEQKQEFELGNLFHIYSRGMDKRDIFLDKFDYERFLDCLRYYNSFHNVDLRAIKDRIEREGSTFVNSKTKVEPSHLSHDLVDVVCYCLMPNHFHLVLRANTDGGIAKFMQKVITGYMMYFNKKYQRSGHLFQGRYKHKEINEDGYFTYLTGYIHLNPVMAKIVDAPERYLYSSYKDYMGINKSDFLRFRGEMLETKERDYRVFVEELMVDKERLRKLEEQNEG